MWSHYQKKDSNIDLNIDQHKFSIDENDIFIGVGEKGYFEKVQEYKDNNEAEDNLENNPFAPSNAKFHVSLSYEDYKKYKQEICDLILEHLGGDKAVCEFKMINTKQLDKELKLLEKAEEELRKYETALSESEHAKYQLGAYPKLTQKLDKMSGRRIRYLPADKDEIQKIRESFKQDKESLLRFRNSDEFTLYIPKEYSESKLLNLLNSINDFLSTKEVSAGLKSDVALSVSQNINIRLEYFSKGEDKARIDAVKKEDEPPSRREKALSELKEHNLYKFLTKEENRLGKKHEIPEKRF